MASKSSKPTNLFRKIGGAVLETGKTHSKFKRGARKPKVKSPKKPRQEIPGKLKGFFESRHAGWPEYVMLKVQLAIMALFVAAVVYLVFLPGDVLNPGIEGNSRGAGIGNGFRDDLDIQTSVDAV